MATMQELMQQSIPLGRPVTVTLKNGKELEGTLRQFDETLFYLQFPNGNLQPVSYELVGTYELSESAVSAQGAANAADLPGAQRLSAEGLCAEIRDSAIGLAALQKQLRKESPSLYQACGSALEALNHAIKVNETAVKFGRTPRVLSSLLECSRGDPGNSCLLALLGEAALLAKDAKLAESALAGYERDWSEACYSSLNLLRLLCALSLQSENRSVLLRLCEKCPSAHRPACAKAMLYLLAELGIPSGLSAGAQPEDAAVFAALAEKLRAPAANAAGPAGSAAAPAAAAFAAEAALPPSDEAPHAAPAAAAAAVPAPSSKHLQGTVTAYFPSTGFGILTDMHGSEYQFVAANLAEAEDKPYLAPGVAVWFTKSTVYSKKKQQMVDAAGNIVLAEQKTAAVLPKPNVQIDFGKYKFIEGETLVVRSKAGTELVGQYRSQNGHSVLLQTADGSEISIPFSEMDALFFCGLITSYNVFSASGRINNDYVFRITNVINKQLVHLLKIGKYNFYPCLYSLIIDGTSSYINTVDFFAKELCEQLVWKAGRIFGVYESGNYFSVDGENRCYESILSDSTVLRYLRGGDFLQQEVFYKTVFHRTVDGRRKGKLSVSVIDIRSKYQIGKVTELLGVEHQNARVQCGSHFYICHSEQKQLSPDAAVKAALGCDEQGVLVAAVCSRGDLSLPTFAEEIRRKKDALESALRSAEAAGDVEQQLSLTRQLLEQLLTSPESAPETIFQLCVRYGRLPYAAQVMAQYGYMLPAPQFSAVMMQLEALLGNEAAAIGHARQYLLCSEGDDAFLLSAARAIIYQKISADSLQEHILQRKPLRFVPRIGYFDSRTRSGYILWDEGKLNFSHKDVVDYDPSAIDPDQFVYHVSFEIDRSRPVPKASEVRILDTLPREGSGREADSAREEPAAGVPDPGMSAFDFPWEDEIPFSSAAVMTLLEFKRDNFDWNGIIGYLPTADRKKIKNGEFTGTAAEAEALINLLRNCYKKRPEFFQATPAEVRPNFLLLAAKLHKSFAREDGEAFFHPQTGNRILFDYALRYLSGNNAREQAEVEYYCESVFRNDFPDSVRYRMEARCLAAYFAGTAEIDLNRCAERSAIVKILRRPCVDPLGLSKMLLNLPEPILDELLDSLPAPLLKEIAHTIIVQLNNADISGEMGLRDAVKQYYTDYHYYLKDFGKKLTNPARTLVNDVQFFLEQFETVTESIGKHLFDTDEAYLAKIRKIVNDIKTELQMEEIGSKTVRLQLEWQNIQSLLRSIGKHPSQLSFESLRPFLMGGQKALADYLNRQYELFPPRLTVRHYGLRNNDRQETIELSNDENRLPANNVKVLHAAPYGQPKGFIVDAKGSRPILGNGQQIDSGKAAEISIPILLDRALAPDVLELSLDLSYEYIVRYDAELGAAETEVRELRGQIIQIPLNILNTDLIGENPYSKFASGDVMKPDDADAKKMFFGRDAEIADICKMLVGADGRLKAGSIVAIYGQKRCGKSSVMFFLGEELKRRCPGTIVLAINAQGKGIGSGDDRDFYYRSLLSDVCTQLQTQIRRTPGLRDALRLAQLRPPTVRDIVGEFGEMYFHEFFQNFREQLGGQYTVLLMVDEFTQIYIHMKRHKINEDFLNRWRAMIHDNGFANIIVGQDFMDKFTTDEEITSQNLGGAVNGLGTMGRKRLTYLDKNAARDMIETPVRFSDGSSRYRGQLGEEAVNYIYDLTGGSAFYLMKFCNALVDYMRDYGEQLVSKSLVDTVARGYVFDTLNDPISKTDFDPIFNEYSYRDLPTGSEPGEGEADISIQVRDEIKKTYRLLKQIADLADSQGVCSVRKLRWDDREERDRYLRSLMIRGVLTDRNGRDITTEQVDQLDVKIKVQLFSIWLKDRG